MKTIKAYIELCKLGIIRGNIITALGGFFLATTGAIEWSVCFGVVAGLSGVIAAGGIVNNYLDQDIDAHMGRTKNRSFPTHKVVAPVAFALAAVLLSIGVVSLYTLTNTLALVFSLLGAVVYLGVYTPLKRHTVYATHIGAIAGAMPVVVGYVAVAGKLDIGAALLFIVLFSWQITHFFAIALYRKDEYANAQVPVWPTVRGAYSTKVQMTLFSVASFVAIVGLRVAGYTSLLYLLAMSVLSTVWVVLAARGFWHKDDKRYGRELFYFSLIFLLAFCVLLTLHK